VGAAGVRAALRRFILGKLVQDCARLCGFQRFSRHSFRFETRADGEAGLLQHMIVVS
jgi:hypothetical protein